MKSVRPSVALVPFSEEAEQEVDRMLVDLPRLYPGAQRWLNRRLGDVVEGTCFARVARVNERLAGIIILTPKSATHTKVSTVFVAPQFRKLGIGRALFEWAHDLFGATSTSTSIVTVAASVEPQLRSLLQAFRYDHIATTLKRYGSNRDELIFRWRKDMPTAVMSILPKFATSVYSGLKKHEYRRCHARFRTGDRILLYETRPTAKITGFFTVGRVKHGNTSLAELEADPLIKRLVSEYLTSAERVTAVEIINPTKFRSPLRIQDISGLARAPQSYQYVQDDVRWDTLQ